MVKKFALIFLFEDLELVNDHQKQLSEVLFGQDPLLQNAHKKGLELINGQCLLLTRPLA